MACPRLRFGLLWIASPHASMPDFLFVTCQIGAEKAVKREVARRWPAFRFAFSQPGFLTFKLPSDHGLAEDFDSGTGFRTGLRVLAGASGRQDARGTRCPGLGTVCKGRVFQGIHVWERDRSNPGEHGFEPSITPAAIDVHGLLIASCPHPNSLSRGADDPLRPIRAGNLMLDCVILSSDQWWIGYHRAKFDTVSLSGRADVAGASGRRGFAGVAEDGGGAAVVGTAHSARGAGGRDRQCPRRGKPGPAGARLSMSWGSTRPKWPRPCWNIRDSPTFAAGAPRSAGESLARYAG